jgi:hypothetical protein
MIRFSVAIRLSSVVVNASRPQKNGASSSRKGCKAAVRADLRARIAPLLGRAGGFAVDGLGQQLKAMVEIRAEVDPGIEAEKTQGWVLDAREDDREDDRDDAEGRLLRLAVEGLVLLALLPGAKAIWAEQDGDSAAVS